MGMRGVRGNSVAPLWDQVGPFEGKTATRYELVGHSSGDQPVTGARPARKLALEGIRRATERVRGKENTDAGSRPQSRDEQQLTMYRQSEYHRDRGARTCWTPPPPPRAAARGRAERVRRRPGLQRFTGSAEGCSDSAAFRRGSKCVHEHVSVGAPRPTSVGACSPAAGRKARFARSRVSLRVRSAPKIARVVRRDKASEASHRRKTPCARTAQRRNSTKLGTIGTCEELDVRDNSGGRPSPAKVND